MLAGLKEELDEQGIRYEVVAGPWRPKNRTIVLEGTGQRAVPRHPIRGRQRCRDESKDDGAARSAICRSPEHTVRVHLRVYARSSASTRHSSYDRRIETGCSRVRGPATLPSRPCWLRLH